MGLLPYAFSVHHFINSVGSDAGFASIIGLAILILLYFAHARETASLREQLYEWAQRAQQLEARVTQLSKQVASMPSQSAAAAPASRDVPAQPARGAAAAASTVAPTAAPTRAPAMAGAPAGVGAPALTAATKLIPVGEEVTGSPLGAVAAAATDSPVDLTAVASPPPATVAGGANGASYDHLDVPQPVAAGRTAAPAPPPRIQIRPGTTAPGRRPPPPPRGQPQRGGGPSRSRRGLVAVLAVVIVAGAVGGLLILTSGGGSSKPKAGTSTSAASSNAAATRHRAKTAPLTPSSVTVAVLNGTPTSGLAGRISQKLVSAGYKPGKVTDAADQTRTATVVEYMPGEKRAALAVAAALKLGASSVQPADSSNQAVACPPPNACTASVIAVLGTDLSGTQ